MLGQPHVPEAEVLGGLGDLDAAPVDDVGGSAEGDCMRRKVPNSTCALPSREVMVGGYATAAHALKAGREQLRAPRPVRGGVGPQEAKARVRSATTWSVSVSPM